MRTDAVGRAYGGPARAGGGAVPGRAAVAVSAGVLSGLVAITASEVWAEHPPVWHRVGAAAGLAAIMVLQLAHSFPGFFPRLSRYRLLTWLLLGLLALLPVTVFGTAWAGTVEFFSASAVLVLPPAMARPVFVLAVVTEWALLRHLPAGPDGPVHAGVEAVLVPLVVIGLSRMSDMIVTLHRSRDELSRLAVSGARLRFARDLHDVLGFSLSAISLKCELAHRLLRDAPGSAQSVITDVLGISRQALTDLRSVSRGYREGSPGRPGRGCTEHHATGAGDRRGAARAGRTDVMPRAADGITLAVLVGYFLSCSAAAWSYAPHSTLLPEAEICLLGCLALQLAESFHRRFPWGAYWTGRVRYGALAAQAVLQFAPFLFFGGAWAGIPGFLAGTALLVLPPAVARPLLVVVAAASGAALYAVGHPLPDVFRATAYTSICALVVLGLTRMAQLASELHSSRAGIARLAVTTERLRFARDLHDLLGFSLCAIILKCELVRRLAHSGPGRAQRELTEVLGIARRALADFRTVSGGSRRMCLAAEVEHAMAMLAGVGIHATVRLDCGELPREVETVLATTLREGLTNMLRHSSAARCRITAERAAGGVWLSLVNDGADGTENPVLGSPPGGGSGIGNLTTRIEAVNGRLTVGPRPDGWFELRAEVALLTL
ncbi:histidine kinase [Streptomyces sp. NPDC058382]|uniref:histidine kinase n=1 Tax=unclassified Streptomyces TaxID=2593676 RepID=UPI00362B1793